MTNSLSGIPRRRERGTAAVEFALILPILVLFLTVPLFLGRVFWYYTVAQKAAHDAVRFLSRATQVEMRTQGAGGGDAPVALLAKAIAVAETAEVRLGGEYVPQIDVQCDMLSCGYGVPTTVRVSVRMRMQDGIFDSFTSMFTGDEGLLLSADVTMRYAGT